MRVKTNKVKSIAMVVVLGAFICVRCSGAEFTLVENGKARTSIVISSDASPAIKFAASELRKFVEKMSGATLKIVTDAQNPPSPRIYLGKSEYTEDLRKEIKTSVNREWGWKESHARVRREESFYLFNKNDNLYIIGGEDRGTIYAVYELLEKFGCRWFMPGDLGEIVPEKSTLTVDLGKKLVQPGFIKRGGICASTPQNIVASKEWRAAIQLWAVRNRFNYNIFEYDKFSKAQQCERRKKDPYEATWYPPSIKYGGGFLMGGGGHCYGTLMRDEKKDHPEYCGLRNGKRSQRNWICTSNPEVIDILKKKFTKYSKEYPYINQFMLAADDGGRFCTCEKCMKIGDKSFTDRSIKLLNEVAAVLPKDTLLGFYAYNKVTSLPVKYIPAENVNVQIAYWCTLRNRSFMPITAKSNSGFKKIVDGWLNTVRNVTVRPYWGHYSYIIPYPMLDVMRVDIPYFYKHNKKVNGWYVETHAQWATQGTQLYLMGKLFWSPTADVDKLLDDYYVKFYGEAAAPFMKKFNNVLEASARRFGVNVYGASMPRDGWNSFSKDEVRRCDELIKQAGIAIEKEGNLAQKRRFAFVETGWKWSVRILGALKDIHEYQTNPKVHNAANASTIIAKAEKTFENFSRYAHTSEGKMAFEPASVKPVLKNILRKIKRLKLNIKQIAPGTYEYRDTMGTKANGMTFLDALDINGFKRGQWGYSLDKGREGRITYLFKAIDGARFDSFEFAPYLVNKFKKSDFENKQVPFGKSFYNRVEFSKDNKSYRTLYENVDNGYFAPYWNFSRYVKGLNKFYIRISAGFPNRETLVYLDYRAKFTVSKSK